MRGGRTNLLGIVPGGSSVPILNAEECDRALLDFDSLKDLNSGLGTVRLGSGASASPVASATRARGVVFLQLLIRKGRRHRHGPVHRHRRGHLSLRQVRPRRIGSR